MAFLTWIKFTSLTLQRGYAIVKDWKKSSENVSVYSTWASYLDELNPAIVPRGCRRRRAYWKQFTKAIRLAVIREVYPGKDGYVRMVKLKTSKGELVRPIQKLIPLEVEHSSPEADNFIESTTTTSETTKGKAANTLEESVAVPKEEPKSLEETSLKTRRGRLIKKPDRFKY